MDYNQLKQRHRAESCQNDLDGKFLLLWFAFNAAYAQDIACLNVNEAATFSQFVTKTCDLDQDKGLTKLVWVGCPSEMINMGFMLMVFDIRML
ncbi:hypothetical protein [Paraglaciecola sp. MB-3u-78]|uniref:hypothetical protein n=1 Tax=Paraglaciecola sp. MB-3u-78 TaxID=2058332 RepID=UPI000C31EE21|nr:hypothetical protein [Paraglaciecola sp. MB-3u-78]PKG96928.1 hypothetical protein CXF95_21675 [Paraglaciecola sp. MB-3u-78]